MMLAGRAELIAIGIRRKIGQVVMSGWLDGLGWICCMRRRTWIGQMARISRGDGLGQIGGERRFGG